MGRHNRRRDLDHLTWPPQEDEVNVLDLDAALPPPVPSSGDDPAGEASSRNGRVGAAGALDQQATDRVLHQPPPRPSRQAPGTPYQDGDRHVGEEAHEHGVRELRERLARDAHVLPPPRPRTGTRPAGDGLPRPSRLHGAWKQLHARLHHLPGGRAVLSRPWLGVALLAAVALAVVASVLWLVPPGRLAAAVFAQPGSAEQSGGARGTSGVAVPKTQRSSAESTEPAGSSSPAPAAAAASTPAYLAVRTQPAGATVFLDDRRVGNAPVTVPQLAAGAHDVMIRSGSQTVRHRIQAGAGEVISLLVPLDAGVAAAPTQGEVATGVKVEAPVELRVFEGDRLVGTSQMARIPLSAGTHHLQLRNDAVGYRDERVVSVQGGRTTALGVTMPEQRVAINAIPWAEVWVDGASVGETPIGNLPLALGTHRIVLRHPQFGEKSVEMLVKANEAGRISVDMRK